MHALHNSHLIRKVLPRHLTKPILQFPDRAALHNRLATRLRESGPAKRAETKAKSQATRALKKAAKRSGEQTAAAEGSQRGDGGED